MHACNLFFIKHYPEDDESYFSDDVDDKNNLHQKKRKENKCNHLFNAKSYLSGRSDLV